MMSYLQVIVINAVKFVKIEMHAHIRGILSESLLSQNIQFFIYVHFFNFQLFILYWCIAINNVVVVSGEQWRDSAIYLYVSILP